jgi:Lrp/AsnC family transcriptional regulator, leucine-responsive regulatory protein
MADPLDPFDRKILALLQQDCQQKAELIAEKVGLSASAVQRRIKRLRADRVIAAEVAILDRHAVGRLMTFIVGLEIERENYTALAHFRRWVGQQAEIQQAYYVTGQVDLILVIVAEDVQAFDAVAARIMENNPQIRRMTTNVMLDLLKVGLDVPVETAP